jgi:type I restriction enzyme S subunit
MRHEWIPYPLGVVADFIDYRGKTPPKKTSGIPLVTAKIVKNNVIQEPTEFISANFYDEWMTRGIPEYGNVVFTTEAPMGEVAQIKTTDKLAFAQRIIVLQGKNDILNDTFLFYALQYEPNKKRIEARSSGTTVFGIKSAELKKVIIDTPDIDTQKKIAAFLSAIDARIAVNTKINHHLEPILLT